MKPLKHPLQTHNDQLRDQAALLGTAKERHRRYQALYKKTAKGKATEARYSKSPTRRAAQARYRSTEQGQQKDEVNNARRIFVGRNYQGLAQTVEQAAVIRTHIKGRLRAFSRQQTGTETESPS